MTPFLIIGLIGALLLAFGLLQMRKLRASQSWVSSVGTIVETGVEETFRRDDADEPDSLTFTPRVRYQFQAGGQTYGGNRIRFDSTGYGNPKRAEQELTRFPVGGPVQVFFDPAKPSDNVLERKSNGAWLLTAIGGAVVLLALVAALR